MAFGDSVIHPHLTKEREALLADKTVDTSGNVHWGQQTFSPADYAKFTAAQTDLGVSEKQLAILHAVHDGKPIPGSEEHVSPHGTTAQQLVDSATYDKDGTMHIGKLEIDKTLAGDFKKVLLEGKPDPEFAAMVEKASQTGHKIVRDDSADSHADGGDVTWDPSHGFTDYHNSANVSPGRVLKHELSHALRDPETQRVAMAIPDGTNTNVEERMAIECENRHADPHEMGPSLARIQRSENDGPEPRSPR